MFALCGDAQARGHRHPVQPMQRQSQMLWMIFKVYHRSFRKEFSACQTEEN
jgi:hypothetical protein